MSKIFMCNNTYYALKDNKLFEITKEEFSNIIRKEAAYKIEPMQINKKMLKG